MNFTNRRENRERTKTLTVILRLTTMALLVDFSFVCFISRSCSCESHLGPERERERERWGFLRLVFFVWRAERCDGGAVISRDDPRKAAGREGPRETSATRNPQVSPVRSNSGTIAAVIERRFWRLTVKAAHYMWAAASPTSHKSYYYPSFKLVTAHHHIMSRVAFVPPIFGS